MVRIFTLLFLIIIIFSSCNSPTNRKGIIRDDVFINVLTDIHLADGVIAVKGYKAVSDSAVIDQIYNSVFEKYCVTQKEFKNTMDYYANHTAKYDILYDKVLTRLSELESQIDMAKTTTEQ